MASYVMDLLRWPPQCCIIGVALLPQPRDERNSRGLPCSDLTLRTSATEFLKESGPYSRFHTQGRRTPTPSSTLHFFPHICPDSELNSSLATCTTQGPFLSLPRLCQLCRGAFCTIDLQFMAPPMFPSNPGPGNGVMCCTLKRVNLGPIFGHCQCWDLVAVK